MRGKAFRRKVNFNHILLSSTSISKAVRKISHQDAFDSEGLQPKQFLNPECLKKTTKGLEKTNKLGPELSLCLVPGLHCN